MVERSSSCASCYFYSSITRETFIAPSLPSEEALCTCISLWLLHNFKCVLTTFPFGWLAKEVISYLLCLPAQCLNYLILPNQSRGIVKSWLLKSLRSFSCFKHFGALVSAYLYVCAISVRGNQISWNWRHRQLCGLWHRIWELNPGPK